MEVSNLGHWWVFGAEKQQPACVACASTKAAGALARALFNTNTYKRIAVSSLFARTRRVDSIRYAPGRGDVRLRLFYSRRRSNEEERKRRGRFLFLLLSGEHVPRGLFLFPCWAGGGGEFITLARRKRLINSSL